MFLIIDMQNDFVDQERGRMVVKGADRLVNGIIEKIKKYEQKKDLIFYTLDIHKKLPGDNRLVKEKKLGQELYPPLKGKLAKHISLEKYYYALSPKF